MLQEIDVQGKKAIIIFVPVPQLRSYQKIQTRLVRELEKKFSGKHVVFIAQVMHINDFDVTSTLVFFVENNDIALSQTEDYEMVFAVLQ
jgi:hypothetical protein